MKKFIILIISLFIGVFLSNNYHHSDTVKKNDITTLAVCTDNNVTTVVANVISTDYSFINTGSDIQYFLNSINANSNNHSTVVSSVILYMSYLISNVRNTLLHQSEVTYLNTTKTLGLSGKIVNKVDFNIYLNHSNNKLGET